MLLVVEYRGRSMLSNIKWMMAKKDPEKLLSLYDESKAHRQQIIDKLRELGEQHTLLEIAKKDPVYRAAILDELMESRALSLNDFIYIFSWLNLSMMHRKVVQYLMDNFSEDQLQSLIDNTELDKVVRRNLKKQTGLDKKKKKDISSYNEDYLKIRMLLEEVDLDADIDEMPEETEGEIRSEMDRIKHYINIRKKLSVQEEYELIRKEMQWWVRQDAFHLRFLLSFINLSRMSPQDKLNLIRQVDHRELLYPENFQFITENAELQFETFQSFFSLTTLGEWIRTFLTTHFAVDLFTLFKQYDQFNWLENYLHSLSIIQNIDLVNFSDSYYLTAQYGYRLHEIIPDETILRRLLVSCKHIQDNIMTNIHVDSFPLEHFLKPLLLVGGSSNFAFIASLMDRRVVENPQHTIHEIEQNYLHLKQRINSPEELKELIENELAEKDGLISRDTHDIITNAYFESITSANYLQPRVIAILKNNLPDIGAFSQSASTHGKILLCKYIALLGLEQHRQMLEDYTRDEDYRIAVHAAIALQSLGDDKVHALLHRFVQSPNYMVRKQVAHSLQLLSDQLDESLILKLAQDKNSEVCCEAIRTISRLPLSTSLAVFAKIVPVTYYKNRPKLAGALGSLGTELALPMLAEIIKEGNSDDYQSVIRALGNISSKVSATMLRTMELKKNPVLEIERARALIRLGDFGSWRVLESYFDFSLGFVRDMAKESFLLLATGEKLAQLREMTFDDSPMIAALATGKLFLYNEAEGWDAIEKLTHSSSADQQFYLTLLLSFLPFKKVRNHLQQMEDKGQGCRTLVALTYADAGNTKLLMDIERNIFNVGQFEQKQIIRAMQEKPSRHCLSIIKKLAMLSDPEILDDTLNLLLQYRTDEILKVVHTLWDKADENGKVSLARLLGKLRSHDIITFIQGHIEHAPIPVKAELAYTMIVQGDENGWDILLQTMSNSNPSIMKIPIPILARLQSNEALDVLVRHLVTPSESIQAELIKAIGSMQLREAIPVLQKYVMNHSNKIKIALAKALSEMDTPETRKMLETLATDHDEYVRVAVDIARQKQTKGLELQRAPVHNVFSSLFSFTDWRLPVSWFSKLAESFRKEFEMHRPQPLANFANKTILDIDELDRRRGRIQDELADKLIGCTDVDVIMQAKEEANQKVESMATREELIRSILEEDCDNCGDDAWNILLLAIESGDEDIIRAIIIASATSANPRWLDVLDRIVQYDALHHLSDFVIFSATTKQSGGVLPIFIRLLDQERTRYYLLYFFNLFVTHPDMLELEHLRMAKEVLKEKTDISPQIAEAAKILLNSLVEHAL